jgi:predicted MPP superfamily phosphohydrolase
VASGAILSSSAITLANQVGELSIERVTLPIPGLPPAFEGYVIAQLTDIHLLPYTRPEFVREVVATANALQPDLVTLTGDYVWHNAEAMDELAPILAGLNARDGVFAVLGNHDYWLDVRAVRAGFAQARLPLLMNEHVTIARGRAQIVLAGLDDGWAGQPDPEAMLANAPTQAPVILLLHEPDLADVHGPTGRYVLQLAGHSHGGQVRVPGRGALVLPYLGQKYDMGLYRVAGMWLYTNRGLGEISVPLRINCPPELTLFTLTRG